MGNAKHIGRVGGLAVAMGIGAAICGSAGAAWADEGASESSESSASATSESATGEGASHSAGEGTAEREAPVSADEDEPRRGTSKRSRTAADEAEGGPRTIKRVTVSESEARSESDDEPDGSPAPAAALSMTTAAGAGRRESDTAATATYTPSSVTVGRGPAGVALGDGETRAYVANSTGRSVSVVDTASGAVLKTIAVPGTASAVAVHGSRAYVTLRSTGKVAVIDTSTHKVVSSVSVGWLPSAIAVNSTGSRVYVTNTGSGTLSVIDATTNRRIASTWLGWSPAGVTVSPDDSRVYAAVTGSDRIIVIDTVNNSVSAAIPVGDAPTDVVVTRDGSRLSATYGGGKVAVIDTATRVLQSPGITVGSNPTALALSATGSRIYVANADDTVSVIDTVTNTVVGSLPVDTNPETGPHDIALSADGATLFVTDDKDATLRIVPTNAPPNRAPEVIGTPFWSLPNWTTGEVTGGASFSDPDGNVLTYNVISYPTKGTVTLRRVGNLTAFSYQPTDASRLAAYSTPGEDNDSFTIAASDGVATAEVPYTVVVAPLSPVNRAPSLQGEPSMQADLNTGRVYGSFTIAEPDGDLVSYSHVDPPEGGVSLYGTSGPATTYTYNFTFYPTDAARKQAEQTAGPDIASFAVTVNDGRGGVTSFTIDAPVEPRPADMPVWREPTVETYDPYTGRTTGRLNVVDPDGDPLIYGTSYGPWYGELNIDNTTGEYVYVPYLTADEGLSTYEIVTVSVDDGRYVTHYDWWVPTFRNDVGPL